MIPVYWASPNDDGLTAACANAAAQGIIEAGAEVELIQLNALDLRMCMACDNGWGQCIKVHTCVMDDDFERLRAMAVAGEALVFVTPVYWWQPAEVMKVFMDRLRRCHAIQDNKPLEGREALMVAAAGGSGNGTVDCLHEMERFAKHLGMRLFDGMTVNRFNRDYKPDQIRRAAQGLARRAMETQN